MGEPIKDGGPAFPVQAYGADGLPESSVELGMTLRDYFAAKAISSVLHGRQSLAANVLASRVYEIADAMLAAREAKP